MGHSAFGTSRPCRRDTRIVKRIDQIGIEARRLLEVLFR